MALLTSQLKNFGCEILQDRRGINRSFCSNPNVILSSLFEISMNAADRELKEK
jgi:hypothetical protein